MKNKNKIYKRFSILVFLMGSFGSIIGSESSLLLNKNTFYGAYKNFIPNKPILTGDKQNQRFFPIQPTAHSLLQQLGGCNKSNVFKPEQLASFKAGGFGLCQEINKGNMTSSPSLLIKPENKSENKPDSVASQKTLSEVFRSIFSEDSLVSEIAQGGVQDAPLNEEIAAKTVAGRAFLLDMLSHPITDVSEIKKRCAAIKKLREMKLRNRNSYQLECVDLEAGCSFKTQELRDFYDQHLFSPSKYTDPKWLTHLVGMRVLRSLYTNHEGPVNDLSSNGFHTVMGGLSAGTDMPSNMSFFEGVRFFGSALGSSFKNHAATVVESVVNTYGVNGWPLLAKGHWLAGGVFTAMPLINCFISHLMMSTSTKKDLVRISVRAGAGTPNTMINTLMDGYQFTQLGESEQFICDYLEKMYYASGLWDNISNTLDVAENEKKSINAFFVELCSIYNELLSFEYSLKHSRTSFELCKNFVYKKAGWAVVSQKLAQLFWKTANMPPDQNPLQQFWVLLGKFDAYLALASYFDRLTAKGLPVCEVEFDEKSNDPCIEIKGAYHPLIAAQTDYKNVKTSDITFNKDMRNIQVVAPNMAGKSVFLSTLLNEIDLGQGTGFMCATSAKMTPVRVRASKNVDESMATQKSTGRAQVNSIGELVDEVETAVKDKAKILLLVDEPCAGLKEVGAQKILFAKSGLIEACDKNPNALCCMVTHFDLREKLKEFKSFKYMNLQVKEEQQNNFEYTYALQDGDGWWFSDPAKRGRFVTWFADRLKKQASKKVQNKVIEYPEFEAMAFEDLPTLTSADSKVAQFMHKFNRTTVTPLEQLQKLNIVGEEKSLFHAIAGDKRERLQTSVGALKLSQWLVSPGTTHEEILRRQKLVDQLKGKANSARRKEVQKVCAEFKKVEQDLAGNAARVAAQSNLYEDGTFKYFKWSVDIKKRLSESSSITVLRTAASLKGMGAYVLAPIVSSVVFHTLLNSFFSIERFVEAWRKNKPMQFLQEAKTWKTAMLKALTPKSPFGKSTFSQFMNQVTGARAVKALYNKDYKTGIFSLCAFIGTCGLTYFMYKAMQESYKSSDYGQADAVLFPYFDTMQKGRLLLKTAAQKFDNSVQLSLDKKFDKAVDEAQNSFLPAGKIECLADYCGYKLRTKGSEEEPLTYKETLPLHDLFDQMGELDAACAIAEWLDMLEEKGFPVCKASFIADKDAVAAQLTMQGAIHPLFPSYHNYNSNEVVKNDFEFGAKGRNYMITAANSAGKSVAIQNAFNVNLAQSIGWALCKNYNAVVCHKIVFNKSINDDMSKGDSTGSAQTGSVLDLADMVEWADKNKKNVFFGCDELLSGTQGALAKDLLFNPEVLGLFVKMNACPRVMSILSTHFDLHTDIQALNSFCSKYMVVIPHKHEESNTYTFEKTFKLADETDHSRDDTTQGNWWINPDKQYLVNAYMQGYYAECLKK